MGQQFVVIRNMPTPGSDAAIARDARMAKKRERKGIVLIEDEGDEKAPEEPKQRQQPVSKDRAKKKKKKRK